MGSPFPPNPCKLQTPEKLRNVILQFLLTKRGHGQHGPYVPKAKPLVLTARLLLAASQTLCQLTARRLASFVKKPSAKWYPP